MFAAGRGDRQQDMDELEQGVPGDRDGFTTSGAGWGRGSINRGRSRILAGATGVAGEPAAGRTDDGNVQLDGGAPAKVEHDMRDRPGVPGWKRFRGEIGRAHV